MQDVAQFRQLAQSAPDRAAFLREGRTEAPVIVTRAPGRLDVIGGVADYSGALVAEATIGEAAVLALALRTDRQIRVWSVGAEQDGFTPQAEFSLEDFFDGGTLLSYTDARAVLTRNPKTRWAAYIAGCFFTLLAEGVVTEFPGGANLLLESQVPLGAGVSSSAAIEVATMQAISVAYGLGLDGVTVARLAQATENHVVGAPCGIMDQMSSALGEENSLFLLLCQPHEVQGTQTLPPSVRIYGINSAVKHSVGGGAYTRARVAAFMGRKVLGVDYLANCNFRETPSFTAIQARNEWLGEAFLSEHGETGDTVTRIDPATTYPVWAATEHGIAEHGRVQNFIRRLAQGSDRITLERAGQLMYEAHASYTRIGLGAEETDLLVKMGCEAGPERGVYGAKISGGGSGGTVVFLTYGDAAEGTIRDIAARYAQQTGLTPQIFLAGASPGAIAFGHQTLDI